MRYDKKIESMQIAPVAIDIIRIGNDSHRTAKQTAPTASKAKQTRSNRSKPENETPKSLDVAIRIAFFRFSYPFHRHVMQTNPFSLSEDKIKRACLLHPCSQLRPTKAIRENMDAKRHAQPNMRPCAPLTGHVVPFLKLVVSVERTSPRDYAFFVPLGSGERPFGIAPTFTRRKYYSKKPPHLCDPSERNVVCSTSSLPRSSA